MSIFTKSVVCSIMLIQGFGLYANEDGKQKAKLNQNIKAGLVISASPAIAWVWTRLKHNLEYWRGINDPAITDLSERRPFLKLLKPDRVEIETEDVLHKGTPLAKRWWVKEYVLEATDTNIERLGKIDFEHKLGKSLMRTSLLVAGIYVAKGCYDSYKEYRNGSFIKDTK